MPPHSFPLVPSLTLYCNRNSIFQVLSDGRIMEFDEPHQLIENHESYFHRMVQDTGRTEAQILKTMARGKYLDAISSDSPTTTGIQSTRL